MTDAPKRVWVEHRTCTVDASGAARLLAMDRQFSRATEYTHEDTVAAMVAEARNAALEEAAQVADARDAAWMRKTYQIEHNRKRYDVPGVERCENKFGNILSEDIAAAIRALKDAAP